MMNRLAVLFLIFSALSCSRDMSRNEYERWVKDPESGFVKSKESGGLQLTLEFTSSRAMALAAPARAWSAYTEKYVLRVKPLKSNERGLLSYASNDMEDYQALSRYYNEGAIHEFSLEVDGETYRPSEYFFEDYQGLSDYNTFTLIFRDEGLKGSTHDRILVWNDQVLTLGMTKFRIHQEDLKKEQAINILQP